MEQAMKKSDLKKVLEPIIKECLAEMLLEEGLLKSVVQQITEGLQPQQQIVVQENKKPSYEEVKQKTNKVIESMKNKRIGGTNVFEGTSPAPAQMSVSSQASNPLGGKDPRDTGVDISKLYNPNWKRLAGS